MSAYRVFTGKHVLLPGSSNPSAATVTVSKDGKILEVLEGVRSKSVFPDISEERFVDAGDKYILPGLVDAHVHLNEPGRTDWEGFATGTRAAASGGVTTVVDMPLNSIPPTTTVDNFETKRAAARGQCWCNVAFWGGVIPGNAGDLRPLVKSGVKGFKCFLIESGVEEFPCVNENDLTSAMAELQQVKTPSTVLSFHAELEKKPQPPSSTDPYDYATFLASRPPTLEEDAIALITQKLMPAHPDVRCHIVHLSAASALPLVREAKGAGLRLSVETCFHYLALAADSIPAGAPEFKCCPPIRNDGNRDQLWEALKSGVIDMVVSDHSPCIASLKRPTPDVPGDFMAAWGGISTLGLGLSVLWTEARKRGGVTIGDIIRWTSVNTSKHAGLDMVKGKIASGYDADLVVWDPEISFTVTKDKFEFKNKMSAYEGLTLFGVVEKTFLGGSLVYQKESGFAGLNPSGKLL